MSIPGSEIQALLTNQAKARISDMIATGKSFKVTTFKVGDGGFDPSDPTLPLTPDPSATDMPGTPGGVFTKLLDSVSLTTPTSPVFTAVLEAGEASGSIGSIGIYAEIVYSPIPADPELGLLFLFALSTRPRLVKVSTDKYIFNLGAF